MNNEYGRYHWLEIIEMNKQMANELYGYISVMNENFNGKIQSPNAFTGNGSTQLVSQLIRKIEVLLKANTELQL